MADPSTRNVDGHSLCLVGYDADIWNWSNIVIRFHQLDFIPRLIGKYNSGILFGSFTENYRGTITMD